MDKNDRSLNKNHQKMDKNDHTSSSGNKWLKIGITLFLAG